MDEKERKREREREREKRWRRERKVAEEGNTKLKGVVGWTMGCGGRTTRCRRGGGAEGVV